MSMSEYRITLKVPYGIPLYSPTQRSPTDTEEAPLLGIDEHGKPHPVPFRMWDNQDVSNIIWLYPNMLQATYVIHLYDSEVEYLRRAKFELEYL